MSGQETYLILASEGHGRWKEVATIPAPWPDAALDAHLALFAGDSAPALEYMVLSSYARDVFRVAAKYEAHRVTREPVA